MIRAEVAGPIASTVGSSRSSSSIPGWQVPGGAMPVTPTSIPASCAASGVCVLMSLKNARKNRSSRCRRRSGSAPNAATCSGLSRIPRASTATASGTSAAGSSPTSTVP
jgi:hypothetical protein